MIERHWYVGERVKIVSGKYNNTYGYYVGSNENYFILSQKLFEVKSTSSRTLDINNISKLIFVKDIVEARSEVVTMREIADKFDIPIEELKIVKQYC